MIRSMTAFSRCCSKIGNKNVTVEFKSVNNRYLDLNVKITKDFSYLEDKIRKYIAESPINRGKLDVYLGIELTQSENTELCVDLAAAKNYIDALTLLRDTFSLPDDITTMRVASNRDIFNIVKTEEDTEKLWEELKPCFDEAMEKFIEMRTLEGEKLKVDILRKLDGIKTMKKTVCDYSETDIKNYREKFETKLKKIIGDSGIELNEQLVLTECAVYADRVAIDEEMVRLDCHFDAFEKILEENEPVGRKLDFLMQEINREVNTTGSKCSNAPIASTVVEIKSELEKIREQIQNIE